MEDVKPRNDASLDPATGGEEIQPGQEFEGSRPGPRTAVLAALVLGGYLVIDHWAQISAMFS